MSEQETTKKAQVRTLGERQIRIEREFDAPRERVFAAHIDPELIRQWWKPAGDGRETTVELLEPHTGGRWRFVITDEEGKSQGFGGAFREVSAPERLAYSFEWDGMPGRVSIDEIEFEDLGERTRIVCISTFHLASEREGMLESGMEAGMEETYVRLDQLLQR